MCGRNIRPRFIDNHLYPPLSNEVAKFPLQNLYLSRFFSIDTFAFDEPITDLPIKFIKATEGCPILDQTTVSYYVDHDGGTFYNQDHDFAIVIPPGAILQGDCVEIQATASHFGPYEFSNEYHLISSFFWVSASYTFTIPVYLIMSHYAVIKSIEDIDNLCVLQACIYDLTVTSKGKLVMKEISNGIYFDYDIRYCVLAVDHFCSYCLQKKLKSIPDIFSSFYYTYDDDEAYIGEVCFCPWNRDCKQVTMYISYVAS